MSKSLAIAHIATGVCAYFVLMIDGSFVRVNIIDHPTTGRYLRTDPDETLWNNLDYLPDC